MNVHRRFLGVRALTVTRVLLKPSACWLLVFSSSLSAQGPGPAATLKGPTCAQCRIDLHLVAQLDGDESGGALGSGPLKVIRVPTGDFVVIGEHGDLMRYNGRGKYLGLVGRKGEGPGEFRSPMMMALDTRGRVHVLDHGLGRKTVLDARGKVVQSGRYPPEFFSRDFHVTHDGEIVVSALVRQPAAIGYSFHRTAGAKIASSFGPELAIAPGSNKGIVRFALASAKIGGFWALRLDSLRIELRRDDGGLLRHLTGELPWFPFIRTPTPSSPTSPPEPRFIGIAERQDGLLTLSAMVAGTRWKDAWGPPTPDPFRAPGGPATRRMITDPELAYGARIVIIDPKSNTILTDRQFDRNIVGFADPDHVVSFGVANDEPVVKVWKVVLTRPGGN